MRTRRLSVALWTAQGVLAAIFLLSGAMKFVIPIEQMAKQTSLPVLFLRFVGVCEVLGAIGLVVPALSRIWPLLTPIAACGLLIIMVGATAVSMPMGWVALFPLSVGLMTAFVAWGRLRADPVRARVGA